MHEGLRRSFSYALYSCLVFYHFHRIGVTLLGFSPDRSYFTPIFSGSKLHFTTLHEATRNPESCSSKAHYALAPLEAAIEAALRPTAALACLRRRPPLFCRLAILPSRQLPGLSSGPRGLCLSPEVCAHERCCSPCTHFLFPAFSRVCTCHPTDVSVCHIRAVPCHLKPSFCLP